MTATTISPELNQSLVEDIPFRFILMFSPNVRMRNKGYKYFGFKFRTQNLKMKDKKQYKVLPSKEGNIT